MTSKRITSLLLMSLCVLWSFDACGEQAESSSPVSTTVPAGEIQAETESENDLTDLEKRARISDDLPDADFSGREFRAAVTVEKVYEIFSEEQTGAIENDSIYERNVRIEDRFGVKIKAIETTDPFSAVVKVASSGDYAYEICGHFDYKAYTPITAGAYYNWYEVPYVNLEKPWYSQDSNDSATINGKIFCVTGDLAVTAMQYTYGVFFNRRICERYGWTDRALYDKVYDGTWVIDDFTEIVSGIYEDIDGDGKVNDTDLFGYGDNPVNPADVWLTSFDQPLTGRDADGNITIELMSEKTVQALEKIVEFHYNNPGCRKYNNQWDEQKYFPQGLAAFAPLAFINCFDKCRDMEDSYGILPNPKWDEAQERYLTNAYDQFSVFGVPMSVPTSDLEFVGMIYEALNAESYKTVYPAYYDVALKGKYSEDEDTANMVDIIMDGRLFDFSFQFGESYFNRIPYWFRDRLAAKKADIATYYEKNIGKVEANLPKLYACYDD